MSDQRFKKLCKDGDIEGVQAAIDNGADVNEVDCDGWTGLMSALFERHNNVAQLLLNHPQIDVNKVDGYGFSPLYCALFKAMRPINQNAVTCFNLLLAHPEVDLDTRDEYQRSPEEVCR